MRDDLDKYISRRKRTDKKFVENFDSGYQEFKVGVLQRRARQQAGITHQRIQLALSPAPHGVLNWDIAEVAHALRLKESDVRLYFTDGRRVSFMLERRICAEVIHGTLASSEGAGYDLIDPAGGHWEVRSITKGGLYFCPSKMVGSGRFFEEGGFLTKLRDVDGYIVSDVESFPNVPYWIIPKTSVESWWRTSKLGSATKVSRDSIF